MKRLYLFGVVLAIILGTFVAFYRLSDSFGQTEENFSKSAVFPETLSSSFSGYFKAKILHISEVDEQSEFFEERVLTLAPIGKVSAPQEFTVPYPGAFADKEGALALGDTVVVGRIHPLSSSASEEFVVVDKYRLPAIGYLVGFFVLLTLAFTRLRGMVAIAGLVFSIFLLVYFLVPSIAGGMNPVVVSLVSALVICVTGIFFSHGVNEKSALSTISTLISLVFAVGLSYFFVEFLDLFGTGSESAVFLEVGFAGGLNLKGLLLAGILIGTLGILDDVTTTQTATIYELSKANEKLSFFGLYSAGLAVGREHIISLVNTLVLAYAGSALPLFLVLSVSSGEPLWVIFNTEFVGEELSRALLGSGALILAVPISTLLSAWYFSLREDQV